MNKISVCIPCYNAENYIANTLISIKLQRIKPFEVILINDASTDRTLKVLEKFDAIEIINHDKNMGIGQTRNTCFKESKGDFIAYISSDDLYERDFLYYMNKVISNIDVKNYCLFTDYFRIYDYVNKMELFCSPLWDDFKEFRSLAIEWALRKNMFVNFSSVLIPRNVFNSCKFENIRYGEDLIFLLDTIIREYSWVCLRKPLIKYLVHKPRGISNNMNNWFSLWGYLKDRLIKMGIEKELIRENYLRDYNLTFRKRRLNKLRNNILN